MKTALITGANKGIGFEAALQLAQKGFHVFLAARDVHRGTEAAATLQRLGLTVTFVQLDVTSHESIQQAVQFISTQTNALDALVNNAGILGTIPQPASAVPMGNVRHVFETNFFGLIDVTQQCLPLLQKSQQPCIVNVTSDLASLTHHSNPAWEYYNYKGAAYGPSKTALNAYTVALAYDLRNTSFKVNAVNPGHTATDFNNYRGEKTAADAASLIVEYATLPGKGPTGKFISDYGESPW